MLVWAMLPLMAVGCVHGADRGGVSPVEDQRGNPEVYWRHQGERREVEPTTPVGPTPAPKTTQE